jgi:cytochrome b
MKAAKNSSVSDTSLIWDLPTRVFHWLLVLAYAVAWLSFDDNRYLYVHVFAGYAFLALLVFRIIWGIVGSHYARFHAFAYDWPSVTAYLKGLLTGSAARHLGHNPAGGWAIFAMLVLGFAVALSGMMVFGGEEGHGPLKSVLSFDVGTAAKDVHEVLAWSMLVLTALHLAGVVFESLFHKENLVWAMICGHKDGGEGKRVSTHGVVGVLLLAGAIVAGLVYFRGYLVETADKPFRPFAGPQLPDNETWRKECGDCHLAFHPTLLPARSWQRLMETQDKHFGDDLALDDTTVAEIADFLVNNAAETKLTEPAHKMMRTIEADQTPLRITETPYWRQKHGEIDERYWKDAKVKSKANCAACHLDANEGTFEDSDMRLPALTQ